MSNRALRDELEKFVWLVEGWEKPPDLAMRSAVDLLHRAAAALKAQEWQPIETLKVGQQALLGNAERKWIRFGRVFPELPRRWYYSTSTEASQFAGKADDDPTHWRPLPDPPEDT